MPTQPAVPTQAAATFWYSVACCVSRAAVDGRVMRMSSSVIATLTPKEVKDLRTVSKSEVWGVDPTMK